MSISIFDPAYYAGWTEDEIAEAARNALKAGENGMMNGHAGVQSYARRRLAALDEAWEGGDDVSVLAFRED